MINSGALHTMKAYKDPGNKTVRFVNLDVSLGCRLRYGPATLVTPYNRVSSATSQEISRTLCRRKLYYCIIAACHWCLS